MTRPDSLPGSVTLLPPAATGRWRRALPAAAGAALLLCSAGCLSPAKSRAAAATANVRTSYGPAEFSCFMEDQRLSQHSGLAASRQFMLVVGDRPPPVVYKVDEVCKVAEAHPIGVPIEDLEDMAQTPDGQLWLGDIGGNRRSRQEVAVLKFSLGSRRAQRYALKYPDGPHDAEALLVSPSKQLVIVTKSESGLAKAYTAETPLLSTKANPLSLVATINIKGFPGRSKGNGASLVTGGAVAPDGTHFVLRTYEDAYEWDAPDTDIVRALQKTRPRVFPLPTTKQGESITYTADGQALLTGTEQLPEPIYRVPIVRRTSQQVELLALRKRVPGVVAALAGLAALVSLVYQLRRPPTRAGAAPGQKVHTD